MQGFEKWTSDGQISISVDYRDKGLTSDGVGVLIKDHVDYGENVEIETTRKHLVELRGIIDEALDYIGHPLKGDKYE